MYFLSKTAAFCPAKVCLFRESCPVLVEKNIFDLDWRVSRRGGAGANREGKAGATSCLKGALWQEENPRAPTRGGRGWGTRSARWKETIYMLLDRQY